MNGSVCTVILTLNEEVNIEIAVRSALQIGDVIVIDAESSDSTARLATQYGATVQVRPWPGFSAQRTYALTLTEAYDWVLFLDADESLDAVLISSIKTQLETNIAGYWLSRRNYFLGHPLLHAGRYPDLQLKLVQPRFSSIEGKLVHERVIVAGRTSRLPGDILHNSRHSVTEFFLKHETYARLEARTIVEARHTPPASSGTLRVGARQRFKTKIWLRLPFRGLLRIIWLLAVKQGWRDGPPAWAYAKMLAAYENMIDVHVRAFEEDRRAASRK